VLTLDTSGILALVNAADAAHRACRAILAAEALPAIVPAAALAEIAYLLRRDFQPPERAAFYQALLDGVHRVHWESADLARAVVLADRYADLPLGMTDATIIACAERSGGRVLSLDRRHFDAVERGERTITRLPREW
jgi:predicted nucleic acid-binding protein